MAGTRGVTDCMYNVHLLSINDYDDSMNRGWSMIYDDVMITIYSGKLRIMVGLMYKTEINFNIHIYIWSTQWLTICV